MTSIILCALIISSGVAAQHIQRNSRSELERIDSLESQFGNIERTFIRSLDSVARSLRNIVKLLNQTDELKASVAAQQADITALKSQDEAQQARTRKLRVQLDNVVVALPGVQPKAIACLGKTVNVSCPAHNNISIISAEYGVYVDACLIGCCEPKSDDCTEQLDINNGDDWEDLQEACNGKQSCTYMYEGGGAVSCATSTTADYLSIVYQCEPQALQFIGFTAYKTGGHQSVSRGLKVALTEVITNAGGGYDAGTSRFTCPITAYYYFYFSLYLQPGTSGRMECSIDLMINSSQVAKGKADHFDPDETSEARLMMSQSSVVQCQAGSVVWLRSTSSNYNQCSVYGSETSRRSTFGGFFAEDLITDYVTIRLVSV